MIAAIVLAAGESSRMGSPKARLPYPEPDGSETSFLAHLLSVFETSRAAPILVVFGHDADRLVSELDLGDARALINRDYRDGMLSSLQMAVRALEIDERISGALVCPVDHPDIDPNVVDTLIAHFEERPSAIVLPVHNGRRGHPVLFSRAVFPELLAAPKTVGARQVVWDHQEDLQEVEVPDAGVTIDIDTPSDYRAFRDKSN